MTESPTEQRVWKLLIENFRWDPPKESGIKLRRGENSPSGPARLQIFEVAVTATFARLRPDYEWCVTPNLAGDGGVDFVGKQQFLTHEAYGIAAAITVGGQCKKHQGDPGVVQHDIAGPLIDMAETLEPTFFVVAFSAHVSEQRIEKARRRVENVFHRPCHILDRLQIEGLLADHLPVLEQVLAVSDLSAPEVEEVQGYFSSIAGARPVEEVSLLVPDDVRAGESFNVKVSVRSAVGAKTRLQWRPARQGAGEAEPVDLIDPVEVATEDGVELMSNSPTDDPFLLQRSLEFRTHAVGDLDLGEIRVEPSPHEASSPEGWTKVGKLRVVENVRPRFFEVPFQPQLRFLTAEYERATNRNVVSVGVVGAGGSGKSRVCEEFSLEQRRGGCGVVTAKQAKSSNDPNLILAELYLGLVGRSVSYESASDSVLEEIAQYDSGLAKRSEPSIRSIFAAGAQRAGSVSEEGVLSTLLLLIMARARHGPLIVHLQDLHWASADVLELLGDLVWQLEKALPDVPRPSAGVFFMLEGRNREKEQAEDGWDSRPFEAFLQKLDCRTTVCRSLGREHGQEFIERLFEGRYTASRLVNDDLLELQRELIKEIDRTAGGNPFHSLEQVRLLREQGVVAQNPETGFLYMVRPQPHGFPLPDRVFASIQMRWQYMKERTPQLALLIWALALLEDRTPGPLFRRLWQGLAPDVALPEVDATELIWTSEAEGRDVSFRHENYFRAMRQFEVSPEERERAVDIYRDWFEGIEKPDPANKFRWARILLERSQPEIAKARRLLKSAERGAHRQGDLRLARRILIVSLNRSWNEDERSQVRTPTFLRYCDEELHLVRDLLGHDRTQAGERIAALRERIEVRLSSGRIRSASAPELQRRLITAEVRGAQHLLNDYRPAKAAELATGALRSIEAVRPDSPGSPAQGWRLLEMEALHSLAVGLALSGELDAALENSKRAVEIAGGSNSSLAGHVICTHAAILLATDPVEADAVLRACIESLDGSPDSAVVKDEADLDLSESLILRAHASPSFEDGTGAEMLTEAYSLLRPLFTRCFQLGQYPDAAAAALLLGVISVMRRSGGEVSWFAQAVSAASRGGHIETLWRSHINLATAMHCHGEPIGGRVRDHAMAAAEIIEETLAYYPQPDSSKRFDVVRFPVAQAARLLSLAEDEQGALLLKRYPRLRDSFADVEKLALHQDRSDRRHYQWLWIDDEGYMLY